MKSNEKIKKVLEVMILILKLISTIIAIVLQLL